MIQDRIKMLRELMKKHNMQAYIIPSSDAHMSEYVAEHYKSREWISGFTGSAGTVVITEENAGLWTDGRYWIQAEMQLKDSGIVLYKTGIPNALTIEDFLKEKINSTDNIGIDASVFSTSYVKGLIKNLKANIMGDFDLVGELWVDRPTIPSEKAFVHELKYSGLPVEEKLRQVREYMKEHKVSSYVLSSLDDVAWLYNIRGFDVRNNPVLISYALVTLDKAFLFTDLSKVSHLSIEGVTILPYEEIIQYVSKIDNSVYYDANKVNYYVTSKIKNDVTVKTGTNFTTLIKTKKNSIEIDNLKHCQVKDGVAMTKFLYWFDQNIENGLDELQVDQKLLEFREEQADFIGRSFDSISAYGANAAMMHYKATPEAYSKIGNNGFYLIDSGGQYMDGTTDITRTAVCGDLTEEQILDYTLVLKGHIQLSKAVFLEGSSGANLDMLAREPMWRYGLDYKCGTGHGVGYLLNVHEGPQGFRNTNTVPFEEGMIITNEPGIYKEGRHGIRIENTLLVQPYKNTEFGQFYSFETISYCPIDMRAVDVSLLSNEEVKWVNDYHKMVFEKLSPYLGEEKEWFKQITNVKN